MQTILIKFVSLSSGPSPHIRTEHHKSQSAGWNKYK